jgi:shikimate kinase
VTGSLRAAGQVPVVALIGLPGSGKSTIGRQLARLWSMPFVDSDLVIEQRIGCSIREYFEREGEQAFRDAEAQVIDELTGAGNRLLLSTGGGVVLRPENRRHLHGRAQVFYLKCSPEDIAARLRNDATRPLLQVEDPAQRLRDLLQQREPLYLETAHYVIQTTGLSVAQAAQRVRMQAELS